MSRPVIGLDASRAALGHHTGTETYALELIKALTPLTAASHQLRLYTSQPPQPADWPTAPHVETRVIPWPRLWTHLRLTAELIQHPPDLLFVPAHVLPLYCPVPAVVTVHDLGYHYFPAAHPHFDRWYLAWTTARHTHTAAHILADSAATRNDLINIYQADPTRISVVHLGRDEQLAPVTDPVRLQTVAERYGIDGPYLLYLGTLQPRKNLVRLITAFHRAATALNRPDLRLVIAGKRGWLYDGILAMGEALGLAEALIFPGFVAETDKAALLSGAEIYLFPSLYEGFGLPVLEAMACGTPVLTSRTSSLPEVAGSAAVLVDPTNTAEIATGLVALLSNPRLRQKLVVAGQAQLQHFSWPQAAAQLLTVLDRVIGTP